MGKLAYLFPSFPVFHQTFVLWEVLGVRRNGLQPRIFSLKKGTERQQPEAVEIAKEVTYLPGLRSSAVWSANWRQISAAPLRYLQLYVDVIRAWRTGDVTVPVQGGLAQRPIPLRDRLRGWYNRQPFLYLLKSLLLVPQAVALAEMLQREGITHLHVHWATYPTTVAYVVKRLTGIPYSFSAHAYDIYMVTRMLPAKIAEAKFVATCAQTNGNFLSSLVSAEVASRIRVVYHGVDVERFTPRQHPGDASDGPLRIVSCGQLERYKGFHSLIDACAELEKRGIRVDCQIVGEGPWRAILEQQIERLGMAKSVKLLGALPHSQLAQLLATADVFALASELGGKSGRRDVIANVLVEAMAAGLPVVATGIPGANELVRDGVCGYLITPNSTSELAQALERLARDPVARARFGQAARERVLEDFDNAKNNRIMAQLFRTALGEGVGVESSTD